jgi:hypothetical protein
VFSVLTFFGSFGLWRITRRLEPLYPSPLTITVQYPLPLLPTAQNHPMPSFWLSGSFVGV